jgi:aldehyde dehydrogenase (NAD+)
MNKAALEKLFKSQKEFFWSGKTRDIDFRIESLTKLKDIVQAYEQEILDAVYKDLHKDAIDGYATEIAGFYAEANYAIKNVHFWAKIESVETPVYMLPSKSYLQKEPYGVTLIISPWNYPFQLLMLPLVGAMAAGNTAILKPSEISFNTSAVLEKIINDTFPQEYLHVVQGAAEETQALLELPVDYIFFTGSVPVGKIVMAAAAKNLTPLTLELGGKSPAIVHKDADLATAAHRIGWGKFLNAGQTCIAPDYVLVHESKKDAFVEKLKKVIHEFYGDDASRHKRYCRIINDQHFQRLIGLLDSKKIIYGGRSNPEDHYIEPTILSPVDWDDPIMQDEIFGPILPILPYSDLDYIIRKINERPKPLSLYLFSENESVEKRITEEIAFGGGAINNTIMHIVSHFLPFGGVGSSGMGKYHGKYSFETFSHFKSILKSSSIADPVGFAEPNKGLVMSMMNKFIR